MGAHIAALRKAAGLTQAELAKLVDETQQNIAYWELADKPPRSDVLPKMAKILGVRLENLLSPDATPERRGGPVGRGQKLFEDISSLPRRQQEKVFEFVEAIVDQYRRKAS
jgi:transcriptional regulator with XRE-family HTH domain